MRSATHTARDTIVSNIVCYLRASQNFTYSTEATKNTSVEIVKIVSNIKRLLSASLAPGAERGLPLLMETPAGRHFQHSRAVANPILLIGTNRRLRLERHHGNSSMRAEGNRVGHYN
jgi:hypothetical protein